MLVPLESSLAVLVMICSKCVSICNRFHARRASSGKITISKGGTRRALVIVLPCYGALETVGVIIIITPL